MQCLFTFKKLSDDKENIYIKGFYFRITYPNKNNYFHKDYLETGKKARSKSFKTTLLFTLSFLTIGILISQFSYH